MDASRRHPLFAVIALAAVSLTGACTPAAVPPSLGSPAPPASSRSHLLRLPPA